ncbi:MAG: hypothetical protein RR620_12375 [Clostridium sp.]
MATGKNIKQLNYINKKILKTMSGLVPGDTVCIDELSTNSNKTDFTFIKLIESDDNYYLVPCNQEGIILIDSLSNEVSLDHWSSKDLKELFSYTA